MATTNKILLKKSSVEGKIPGSFDIEFGELALNFADGRLYFKDSNNDIQFFDKAESEVDSDFTVLLTDLNLGKVTDNEVTNRLDFRSVIDSVDDSFDLGSVVISGPVFPSLFILPSSTVADLPDGNTGQMLLVTDEINGPVPAFYDGNNWKRVSDNQTVSAT